MTEKRRPSVPLRTFARRAAAAWEDVRQAEAAAGELRGEPQVGKVLKHLGTAKEALRRAYCEIVPFGRRTGRVPIASLRRRSDDPAHRTAATEWRQEALHRCLLCAGMVWERQRRSHLDLIDGINVSAFEERHLAAYFEPIDPQSLGDEDDEDDEGRGLDGL